jgi:two-component system, chemotaxis family, protein-glutamate methylesterase/glutaminase
MFRAAGGSTRCARDLPHGPLSRRPGGAPVLQRRVPVLPGHDIIAIGASAGGVEALARLVSYLPADLPASVFVVVHIPPDATSVLPDILARKGALPAEHAHDGVRFQPGRIYIAPPDRHLLIKDGHLRCTRGPRENATRPSIDPMFRTAAQAYGPRVVAVVLSGTLDDGTVGLGVVKSRGGVALVQDPQEALYPGMPTSAIENVAVDAVLPLEAMAAEIVRLAGQEVSASAPPVKDRVEYEIDVAEMDPKVILSREWVGAPTDLTCPECRGALLRMGGGDVEHFRCRVGHSYSPETLYSQQARVVEAAIWSALQVLEERFSMAGRMAERMEERGQPRIALRYHEQSLEARAHADVLRRVLVGRDDDAGLEPVAPPAGNGGPSAGGEGTATPAQGATGADAA